MENQDFIAYIEASIARCRKKEQELIQQSKKDEANMERIKNNVYGIAKALYTVTQTTATKNGEDHGVAFVRKLETVREPWEESLALARQHSDSEKECIELIKLSIIEEIQHVYQNGGTK